MQEGDDKNLKCGVVSASLFPICNSDDIDMNYNDGLVDTQEDFAQLLNPGVNFHIHKHMHTHTCFNFLLEITRCESYFFELM